MSISFLLLLTQMHKMTESDSFVDLGSNLPPEIHFHIMIKALKLYDRTFPEYLY